MAKLPPLKDNKSALYVMYDNVLKTESGRKFLVRLLKSLELFEPNFHDKGRDSSNSALYHFRSGRQSVGQSIIKELYENHPNMIGDLVSEVLNEE